MRPENSYSRAEFWRKTLSGTNLPNNNAGKAIAFKHVIRFLIVKLSNLDFLIYNIFLFSWEVW